MLMQNQGYDLCLFNCTFTLKTTSINPVNVRVLKTYKCIKHSYWENIICNYNALTLEP